MVLERGERNEKRRKGKNVEEEEEEWYGPLVEGGRDVKESEKRKELATIDIREKEGESEKKYSASGHTDQRISSTGSRRDTPPFGQKKGISVFGREGTDTFLVAVCLGQDPPPFPFIHQDIPALSVDTLQAPIDTPSLPFTHPARHICITTTAQYWPPTYINYTQCTRHVIAFLVEKKLFFYSYSYASSDLTS